MFETLVAAGSILPLAIAGVGFWQIRSKHMDRWLGDYLRQFTHRMHSPTGDIHLLICVADHFEPKYEGVTGEKALARVNLWVEEYPQSMGGFRDSDGRKPRHTFFYPSEEYEPELLDALGKLCAMGHGEVEIHLHHDRDTADNLRQTLVQFRDTLANRHGLLARRKNTGETAYAFIHGNWALCNPLPGGDLCGVNEEIDILLETGCYADLTMPSAPSPLQSPLVNRLYYASNLPGKSCSHNQGVDVGKGPQPPKSLLMIQGPLVLNWRKRKLGLLPGLENGCIQATQPPSIDRVDNWLRARVQVPTRPDWYFVKLHCHGTIESHHDALIPGKAKFHDQLAERARRDPKFHYHYVTSREMYNLIKAAEAGWKGSVHDALNYELEAGPALR